ncbi:hypothetical protein EB796_020489 [Bugula neritina]|uniref:Uncharacterized protein n=1 Tax=Bugula neritina TaxID=10212 RepID=A0A7J7J4Z3_BUGNE|nr:hypothetical protein EB796_020489 [Bugula neritina]
MSLFHMLHAHCLVYKISQSSPVKRDECSGTSGSRRKLCLANQVVAGKRGGVSSLPDIGEGGYHETQYDELKKLERLLAKESRESQYLGKGQGQGQETADLNSYMPDGYSEQKERERLIQSILSKLKWDVDKLQDSYPTTTPSHNILYKYLSLLRNGSD